MRRRLPGRLIEASRLHSRNQRRRLPELRGRAGAQLLTDAADGLRQAAGHVPNWPINPPHPAGPGSVRMQLIRRIGC